MSTMTTVSVTTAMSPVLFSRDIGRRPAWLSAWEIRRHKHLYWLMEMVAEGFGTFFYTFPGVGATAAYILGNLTQQANIGSLFAVGFAYAAGILLAMILSTSVSGGHLSPGVTIMAVVFHGFPPLKALRYIVAQILGSFIACLLVYAQYRDLIVEVMAGMEAKGVLDSLMFTPEGPGAIIALYVTPGTYLPRVLLNEFMCDMFVCLMLLAALDTTNIYSPPAARPWIMGLAYGAAIWGFVPVGIALNSARDIGGRLAAMSIWGLKASGGPYAAIASLTNILAMLVAALLYEIFFHDSLRTVTPAGLDSIVSHVTWLKARGEPSHVELPMFIQTPGKFPDSPDLEKQM